LAQHGLVIGVVLVALATGCALLLAAKAARGVARFRAEEHESVTRKERR